MKERLHVFVSGVVQGVFFRANTEEKALDLGLTGWVRNTRDGRVEVLAEGEKEILQELLRWLHRGPSSARVTHVDYEWQHYTGEFKNFSIRY